MEIVKCSEGYRKSIIPEEYCKTHEEGACWGCKHLHSINLSTPRNSYYLDKNYKYWFQIGNFESENFWKIDKERIVQIIKREISLKRINVCPILTEINIQDALITIPNEINVTESEGWEINFEEIYNKNQMEKKPIGIMPKGLMSHSDYLSTGLSLHINLDDDDETSETTSKYIPETTFDDIGGIDDIVSDVREVIELPLKHPQLFEYLGVTPHRGILLWGQPGCGKTLIAKAIANDIKAHFISIRGPEVLNKYIGQSEENLREIFFEARKFQPSIIFFDEIDSIAPKRTGADNERYSDRLVNQLLTMMDGIEDLGNVCVIGSTNRIELIDDALLRPGRFDYSLEVKKPTLQGCLKIFSIHTAKMPVSNKMNIKTFSKRLIGLSGAEIAFVAREGAYNCIRRELNISDLIKNTSERLPTDFSNLIIEEVDFKTALSKLNNSNCS